MTINLYALTPNTPICDFCSQTPVVSRYPTQSFVVPNTPLGSDGDWAACRICSDLIENNDRAGLAVRSAETLQSPMSEEDKIAAVQVMHAGFFAHRAGAKVNA